MSDPLILKIVTPAQLEAIAQELRAARSRGDGVNSTQRVNWEDAAFHLENAAAYLAAGHRRRAE